MTDPAPPVRRVELLHLDPLACARVTAGLFAGALIVAIPLRIVAEMIALVGGAVPVQKPFAPPVMMTIVIGAPVLAGLIGFFAGLIVAVLYNLIAHWFGGLRLRLRDQ